jgi:hypothetical protein
MEIYTFRLVYENKKTFHFERVSFSKMKELHYLILYSESFRYKVVTAIPSNSAALVLLPFV